MENDRILQEILNVKDHLLDVQEGINALSTRLAVFEEHKKPCEMKFNAIEKRLDDKGATMKQKWIIAGSIVVALITSLGAIITVLIKN